MAYSVASRTVLTIEGAETNLLNIILTCDTNITPWCNCTGRWKKTRSPWIVTSYTNITDSIEPADRSSRCNLVTQVLVRYRTNKGRQPTGRYQVRHQLIFVFSGIVSRDNYLTEANVPAGKSQAKNIEKCFSILKVTEERSWIWSWSRIWIQIHLPEVRIPRCGSTLKCHGSANTGRA